MANQPRNPNRNQYRPPEPEFEPQSEVEPESMPSAPETVAPASPANIPTRISNLIQTLISAAQLGLSARADIRSIIWITSKPEPMKDIFKKKDFSDPDFSKSIKDVDKKTGIVTGYYAAFNNVDLGGDMIEPGAFAKTIAERGPQGANRIQFLNQHDTWQNLGKPQVLKEDNYGLYHESKISQTTLGKDALILLDDKVLDSFSIGYRVTTENMVNDVNHLKEIYLYEGSLVTFPMNENAIVTGVKGIDVERLDRKIKQLEKFCRDTTASDDTIELLLIHIKQMQQALVDLATTTPPSEKDTGPGTKDNDAAETLIREVNRMRMVQEIKQFSNQLKTN